MQELWGDIKDKTFDWDKLKEEKKTLPTQQRKILDFRVIKLIKCYHV